MKKIILAVGMIFLCADLFAGSMDANVQAIIRSSKLKSADVGVYAVLIPKDEVLADINKDLLLNPASCMKLITSAVALKTLGPDYQFPTQFYLDLLNNLWVKGFGDPGLVIERLDEMANRLVKSGLPANIGDIFIDDTFFDMGDFPGRQKGSARSYNALTSAVALNHGAVTVEVFPGAKRGALAQVVVDAPGINVENNAQTAPKRSHTRINISRAYTKNGDTIVVTGRIPLGSGGRKQFFNVANPAEHFGESLKAMLTERGINVTGGIKYGSLPKIARLLLEEKSPPITVLLKNMNKNSSNFMAEQITKTVGAKMYGEPGTTEKGVQAFTKYLMSLGNKNFYIENGSGLSYKNEISPYLLYTVMKDIYNDQRLRDVYIDSLSVSGEDGTLKKSHSSVLAGRLKAKTGSLNRISSLAGFLSDGQNMIIFAIFLNGGRIDFWKGRNTSQKIVESLVLNK